MLIHFTKLVIRTIRTKLLFTSVNLLGISLGVLASGLAYLFIRYELSYDKFHVNANSIYRVNSHFHIPDLSNPDFNFAAISDPLSEQIREKLPGIVQSTRFIKGYNEVMIQLENETFAEKLTFVDSGFLQLFSFQVLKSNTPSPLKDNSGIVLTETISKKFFGEVDPIGKQIVVIENEQQRSYTVKAIVIDPPGNSSITFKLLVPIQNLQGYTELASAWTEHNYSFFVQLAKGNNQSAFQKGLDRLTEELQKTIVSNGVYHTSLTPLLQIHGNTQIPWEKTSDPRNIKIFLGIVLIVIIIASANFVTLSIVNSSTRNTEIGVKKVFGASRSSILLQFMYEAFILTLIGSVFGIATIAFITPFLNTIVGTSMQINFDVTDAIFCCSVLIVLSTVAGLYPAILFSSFNSRQIIKGQSALIVKSTVAYILVVFQFSLSICLAGCSLIMTRQMIFINNLDLGFKFDQVIVVPSFSSSKDTQNVISNFKTEAMKEPLILSVSACSNTFFEGISRMGYTSKDGDKKSARAYRVDPDFFKTMGIELEEGRFFNESSVDSQAVIINRQLAQEISDTPLHELFLWGQGQRSEIIGVVKDFNYQSLEFPIQPLFLSMNKALPPASTLLIKVRPENIPQAITRIESIFKQANPGKPFNYKFLSDSVDKLYSSYRMWTYIIALANIFVSFIAVVGLFGLAGVEVRNKFRQIGIRKAFGASSAQIFFYVSRRYLFLILIAASIGIPISSWLMSNWLSQFAYRINVDFKTYMTIFTLGLITTLLAVMYHTLIGARLNPAKTLRYHD